MWWIINLILIISQCQVTIFKDNALNVAVICPDPTCSLGVQNNYQGIAPTLTAANSIYVPYNALGLVSSNPLKITDYFSGTWVIKNGTNGTNGASGKDGLNGKDFDPLIMWILIVWNILLTISIVILIIYLCKQRKKQQQINTELTMTKNNDVINITTSSDVNVHGFG